MWTRRSSSRSAGDLNAFDRFIKEVEPNDYTMPILLKRYLKLNGKIIGFNLDPKFNDALDGMLVLDLYDVPMETIASLSKEINDDSILERFYGRRRSKFRLLLPRFFTYLRLHLIHPEMHRILLSLAIALALSACAETETGLEKKAARIHKAAFTVDSHTDTPLAAYRIPVSISW